MVLLTSVILGLCMGSGVVFAQLYGAGRTDEMKCSIYNAFLFILGISAVINLAAFFLLEHFLVWLHIPQEAVELTRQYLQIILPAWYSSQPTTFLPPSSERGGHSGAAYLSRSGRRDQCGAGPCVDFALSHGGLRRGLGDGDGTGPVGAVHHPSTFLQRPGAFVLKKTPSPPPAHPAPDCHQFPADGHPAVHYEFRHFVGAGFGQQLWLCRQRRLCRGGEN